VEIVWYGLSCFRMSERRMATVVTDPYDKSLGLPEPKLKADVVTVSHDAPGHNNVKAVKGKRRVISGPGEFEIGDVFIIGIPMAPQKDKDKNARLNMIYVYDYHGLTVAHLGDLAYVPSQSQIEHLGAVDIAMVPVGGGKALTPSQAAEVISLIEPSIVIPMHYKTDSVTLKLGKVDRFLSEMGITKQEPLPELKVSKSNLSPETQVVLLMAPK
jgi:L-ascorbate metabolism protein UlaG (beta-lactamase superfamily)